jgi:hypothetical protein
VDTWGCVYAGFVSIELFEVEGLMAKGRILGPASVLKNCSWADLESARRL